MREEIKTWVTTNADRKAPPGWTFCVASEFGTGNFYLLPTQAHNFIGTTGPAWTIQAPASPGD